MPGPTKGKEKKPKETKFELVKRGAENPLSWIGKKYKRVPESKVRRYKGYLGRTRKSTETKLEKDYQKEAFIDKRLKAVRKKGVKTSKEKLEKIYSRQFENRYQKKKHTGYQTGGTVNTGRENLLEEVGRIDAERTDPNRRAEKRRVVGELNRGFAEGGGVGTSKEDKRRKRRSLAYEKARARKPSGRLSPDDLKRELDRGPGKRAGLLSGIKDFVKRRKRLGPDLKKMIAKHDEMFKKIKKSRKKLSPHQEAKHPDLRHVLDQPGPTRKKKGSPHKKQTMLEKLMAGAGKAGKMKPRSPIKKQRGGSMGAGNPFMDRGRISGSLGGGMNPMGRSPDPTVRSVTGYDGGGKVAGRLATRGYGKARR